MERFAIKIDKKLKANLYKICRLCGMDYPDMIPILTEGSEVAAKDDQAIDVEGEMEMSLKINVLIGLMITKDDRMPQTMCGLCVDKINDFYEFREMCYATNAQTRKLLGLKNIKKPVIIESKPKVEFKEEPTIIPPLPNKFLNRKRKAEPEAPVPPKKETAPPAVSNKKLRLAAPILKEAATKKAKMKGKDVKDTKEEEKDTAVKEEIREVITRKTKLMKGKDSKDTKDDGKDVAVKEETKETNSKKDGKEKGLKKDTKEAALKKDSKEIVSKKDSKEVTSKKESKDVVPKKGKHKGKEVKDTQDDGKDNAVKEEIKEEIKEEPPPPAPPVPPTAASAPPPSAKLKQGCTICTERFSTKGKLEAHIRSQHIPKIERYVCSACNETISKSFDIKNHQLWHKLSKTPYVCGLCGESIVSTYAYARHLHEHNFETPPAFMVLDRECPQCHVSYATNFLYNTHPCAVKTRRCAGCNRLQRSEVEYVKHSALCAKVYLNYSKHIAPAVEAQEDAVRIKNENEVEAAAEEMARLTGMPLDMTPVVHLTRLSSPLIMAANQCVSIPGLDESPTTTGKKSGKKGVSKKELKRVDELLKSTLDALVSIKHEPEVHVETEAPPVDGDTSDNEPSEQDQNMDSRFQEDYHHNEDSDDGNDKELGNRSGVLENQDSLKIKQEADENLESVEGSENVNKSSGGGLKLKIRKEHGQLNSSIIEQQSVEKRAEKRKKKKKHKDKEKDKQQKAQKEHQEEPNSLDSFNAQHIEDNPSTDASAPIQIKMEPLEAMDTEELSATPAQNRPQPEATIMTSIPMMQLQIACISEGVEFNGANADTDANGDEQTNSVPNNHVSEQEDVKPNREELDRMLQISNVTSGVEMEAVVKIPRVPGGIEMETDEPESEIPMDHDGKEDNHDGSQDEQRQDENDRDNQIVETSALNHNEEPSEKARAKPKLKPKVVAKPPSKSRNKACKSTAKPSAPPPVLQISAIQSGVTLPVPTEPTQSDFIPMFIKPEPQNRGYSDEQPLPSPSLSPSPSPTPSSPISPPPQNDPEEHLPTQQFNAEEQAYISSIDFNNITVKQEKDLDINDVQISAKKSRSRNDYINGIKKRKVNNPRPVHDSEEADENMEDNDVAQDDDIEDEEEESEQEDEEQEEEEEEEEPEEEEEEDDEEEEREYRELEYPPKLNDPQEEQNDQTEESEIETDEASCNTLQEAPEDLPSNTQDTNDTDNSNINESVETKNDPSSDSPPESASLPSQLASFVISNVCSHAPDLMPLPIENHEKSEQSREAAVVSREMSEQVSALIDKDTIEQSALNNLEHVQTPVEPQRIDIEDHKDLSNTNMDSQQLLGSAPYQPQENYNLVESQKEERPQITNELQVPVLKMGSVVPIEFNEQTSFETNPKIEVRTNPEVMSHEGTIDRSSAVDPTKNEVTAPGELSEMGIRIQDVVTQIQIKSILDTVAGPNQLGTIVNANDETQANIDKSQTTTAIIDQDQRGTTVETSFVQDQTDVFEDHQNERGLETDKASVYQGLSGLAPGEITDGSSIPGLIIEGSTTKTIETNIVPGQSGTTAIVQDESTKPEAFVETCQSEITTEATVTQVQSTRADAFVDPWQSGVVSNPCLSISGLNIEEGQSHTAAATEMETTCLTAVPNPNQDPYVILAQDNTNSQQLNDIDPGQSGSTSMETTIQSSTETIEGIVIQTAEMQLHAQPIFESQENADPSCADQAGNEGEDDDEEYDENEEDEYEDGEEPEDEEGVEIEDEMTRDEQAELEQNEQAEDKVEAQEERVDSEDHSNINLEEQQNQQNQDQQYSTRPTALALHPYLEDISSSSNSFLSNALSETPPPNQSTVAVMESSTSRNCNSSSLQQQQSQNNEETENILNESNYMLSRRRQPTSSSMAPLNFDNINEIAENNNNANIEREQLQDDQQQQRQHQYHQQMPDDVT